MRRFARLLLVVLTFGSLTMVAAPTAQAGSTYKSMSLSSGVTTVHSSSGKHLKVLVNASKVLTQGDTSDVALSVEVLRGSPYGGPGETHTWRFNINRSSLDYNSSSGNGSLATGSQIHPFGTMDLAFNKTGKTTSRCKVSGTYTSITGHLHGAFHFDTRTGPWGSVGSNTFSFDTPNSIGINNGCTTGEGPSYCFRSLGWSGPGNFTAGGSESENGYVFTSAGGKSSSRISGNRYVSLNNPSGATRSDSLTSAEPEPSIANGDLSITTRSKGPIDGGAKLSGGQASSNTSACKEGGHKKHQHSTYHSAASWSSKAGHRLTFHFAVTPDLVAPASGNGSWDKFTVSA
jgi:hypothetical protein